jgi:hypothetical protein
MLLLLWSLVLVIILVVEPPTVEQVTASFGYALMKQRAHMMLLVVPYSRIIFHYDKKVPSFATTTLVVPKNLRKVHSSVNNNLIPWPLLLWMSLPMRRKSSGKSSVPRLHLLLFISVMVEAEVQAAKDDDDDVTGRVAPAGGQVLR